MKNLSLLASIFCLSLLALSLILLPAKAITDTSSLSSLLSNQKVMIQGTVEKEVFIKETHLITLNNITIDCSLNTNTKLKDKNISLLGIISEFEEEKQIRALKISIK